MADPQSAADHLMTTAEVFGVVTATGRRSSSGGAIFELTLRPLPALEAVGYPTERVRIALLPDGRAHVYVLDGRDRPFKHRNPAPCRGLCLEYPRDDPALRWLPDDGFEALVSVVHRHLMFEEAWRRYGQWPCEDAPHGDRPGPPHPVVTKRMKRERQRWAR
jgi:hypothetical protein